MANNEKVLSSREFRLESISLVDAAGAFVDIRTHVVELLVRQDIYVGYIHGEAIIVDGVDLVAQHGIHGNE